MGKKIVNDEKFFQNNGYLIKKIGDLRSFKYLVDKFNKSLIIKKYFSNKNFNLNKLHKYLKKKNLNNLRVSIIKEINEDSKFNQCYYNDSNFFTDSK